MKLVDTNVLLYAVNEDSAHHEQAHDWLDRALSGAAPVGLAWVALLAFIRVSTRPQIFAAPLSPAEAVTQVTDWLAQPAAHLLHPTPRHVDVLGRLLDESGTSGNLTSDAHLAALAIEHRATVVTFDRDFARFPGLRSELPRVGA